MEIGETIQKLIGQLVWSTQYSNKQLVEDSAVLQLTTIFTQRTLIAKELEQV